MPCKCLTGCINKKCSCRAKGVACSYECTYCAMKDKYECFNVPGKEPPVKTKPKPKSKKGSRKNSKVSEDSDDSKDEKAVVVASKEITKKKEDKGGEDDKVVHQTVIINNYYSHNEYKQQNNAYTQVVNHTYENSENSASNSEQKVDHLIKNLSLSDNEDDSKSPEVINLDDSDDDDDTTKNKVNNKTSNRTSSSSLPKLTETLANDFLKFYWECLSTKSKTKFLEKYVCSGAELRIQGVPFIGSKVIVNRLEEAAPMKINKMEFNIYPTEAPAVKKFSVTEINKKLLQKQPVKALTSSAQSSSAAETSSEPSKDETSDSTSSKTNTSTSVNKLLATYHRTYSPSSALNNSKESKSLVFANPNLSPIGRIETDGVMMDANGYTADFTQNFYLVYNKILNVVQFNNSELKWKV